MTKEDQDYIDKEVAPRATEHWKDRAANESILEFVGENASGSSARIFDVVGMTSDKRVIIIEEACDHHFELAFNKSQFGELIMALRALHSEMTE
jgi:hypothetical protein